MKPFDHHPPPTYRIPEYLKKYLGNRGISYRRLSDVPVQTIREAQLELVFDRMESIMLPPVAIETLASSPVLKQMLVTRVGSCDRARGHYIPRPEGSHEVVMHFCREGRGWLRTKGGLRTITSGKGFLIPPGEPHAYGSSEKEPWSILWIHATGPLVEDFLELLNLSGQEPVFPILNLPHLRDLHARIFREMERRHDPANLISASGKLYDFLTYLLSGQRGSAASQASVQLRQAITHMESHVHESLTLEELARAAGLSVSRFSFLFKQAEGISPGAYFTQLRMQQPARYLLSNPVSITEVARKTGYEDPYYFSRVFKSVMGKSPRDYRKSFQK